MEPILKLTVLDWAKQRSTFQTDSGLSNNWGTVEIRDNGQEGDDCIAGHYRYKMLDNGTEEMPVNWKDPELFVPIEEQDLGLTPVNIGDPMVTLAVEKPAVSLRKLQEDAVTERLLNPDNRAAILALKSGMIDDVDL